MYALDINGKVLVAGVGAGAVVTAAQGSQGLGHWGAGAASVKTRFRAHSKHCGGRTWARAAGSTSQHRW